jgi:hypothetical protein
MKLKEIFDQLTYGELSQLAIGGGDNGAIRVQDYNRILAHVNLGLTALYKRFPLKEGRVKILLQAGMTNYPIVSNYALTNPRTRFSPKFIQDSAASPFKDGIHKIEKVFTDSGFEMSLNDEADPYSVFTPTATMLRVPSLVVAKSLDLPAELQTTGLELVYRANHPILVTDDGDLEPEEVEVELPYSHLEPLLLFIASRVHTPTGMTNETNMGNNYYAKYEAACQQIELTNLKVDSNSQPDRIARNGWV